MKLSNTQVRIPPWTTSMPVRNNAPNSRASRVVHAGRRGSVSASPPFRLRHRCGDSLLSDLNPSCLNYYSTQVLCSACYPLTNLAAMSKDLSLRNTEEEVKARMAHFLQVNGHGTEASTAQTVSLVHECYAIAYSLRVSLR